jgi:hypothetical protein
MICDKIDLQGFSTFLEFEFVLAYCSSFLEEQYFAINFQTNWGLADAYVALGQRHYSGG